ncbi:MAG: thioesterase family protein [Actinobacteria bacterium]|nr:thioesterase family protein [Actinomycetota bacterium]
MSSVREFVALLDVDEVATGRFVATSDAGDRGIVDGSQVLSQSMVAASKTSPGRSVRSARATFLRTIAAGVDLEFDVHIVKAGRLMAFADVTCRQGERVCVRTQVVLDAPQPDFIRHAASPTESTSPDAAIDRVMPMDGRTLRLDGVVDENDPDEFGPPTLRAWLRYDAIPDRDDVRKALLAHFTGHLAISTSLRAHRGVGTAQSHKSISTAPIVISIAFHEPVTWTDWLLYEHDSTFAGAGMSFVRGGIYASGRDLIASFSQEAMIRGLEAHELEIEESVRL